MNNVIVFGTPTRDKTANYASHRCNKLICAKHDVSKEFRSGNVTITGIIQVVHRFNVWSKK